MLFQRSIPWRDSGGTIGMERLVRQVAASQKVPSGNEHLKHKAGHLHNGFSGSGAINDQRKYLPINLVDRF